MRTTNLCWNCLTLRLTQTYSMTKRTLLELQFKITISICSGRSDASSFVFVLVSFRFVFVLFCFVFFTARPAQQNADESGMAPLPAPEQSGSSSMHEHLRLVVLRPTGWPKSLGTEIEIETEMKRKRNKKARSETIRKDGKTIRE